MLRTIAYLTTHACRTVIPLAHAVPIADVDFQPAASHSSHKQKALGSRDLATRTSGCYALKKGGRFGDITNVAFALHKIASATFAGFCAGDIFAGGWPHPFRRTCPVGFTQCMGRRLQRSPSILSITPNRPRRQCSSQP